MLSFILDAIEAARFLQGFLIRPLICRCTEGAACTDMAARQRPLAPSGQFEGMLKGSHGLVHVGQVNDAGQTGDRGADGQDVDTDRS